MRELLATWSFHCKNPESSNIMKESPMLIKIISEHNNQSIPCHPAGAHCSGNHAPLQRPTNFSSI